MSYETIDPSEAHARVSEQGWQYLDVRSVMEFDAGHPAGAYNVPILDMDAMGRMVPNASFVEIVAKHFPRDARLVVGCKMGGRSMHACEFLTQAGFTNLANMHGGYSGAEDTPGWQARDLPISSAAEAGRDYAALRGA